MVRLKYFACTENKIKKCRYKCKVERVSANHTHTQICTKQYTCRHARVRHCLSCSDSLICLHLTVRPLKLSHLERSWENYGSDVVGRWHSVGSQKYVVHCSVLHRIGIGVSNAEPVCTCLQRTQWKAPAHHLHTTSAPTLPPRT